MVDTKVTRSLGDGGNAISPYSDLSMGLSSGHPLVVDLNEERVSIPSSPYCMSLELEVVSSMVLDEFVAMVPPLGYTGALCNQLA